MPGQPDQLQTGAEVIVGAAALECAIPDVLPGALVVGLGALGVARGVEVVVRPRALVVGLDVQADVLDAEAHVRTTVMDVQADALVHVTVAVISRAMVHVMAVEVVVRDRALVYAADLAVQGAHLAAVAVEVHVLIIAAETVRITNRRTEYAKRFLEYGE